MNNKEIIMEMISPNQYREKNKDKDLEELLAIKEDLQQKLEKMSVHKEIRESVFLSDTRPLMYQKYIEEITKLIQEKSEQINI